MGYDNDCTGATHGEHPGGPFSGEDGIPAHWTQKFHNKVYTYIKGYPEMALDDVINRFVALAKEKKA